MKNIQEKRFEAWFKEQPFYLNALNEYGEMLFDKCDDGHYWHDAVRFAYAGFQRIAQDYTELDLCKKEIVRLRHKIIFLNLCCMLLILALLGVVAL